MFKFGFELEGFYMLNEQTVAVPPKHYPHDDFPGLVEVRNVGGGSIRDQLFLLYGEADKWDRVDWDLHEHKFTPKERSIIRSRHYEKGGVEINNIYGKSPKDIGSKTLASFQINISNFIGTGANGRDHYGVFDFVEVIRNLDKEFHEEIKESGRQPGFYSVKDNIRMEYRSLPNSVALSWSDTPTTLIKRIEKCL